MTKGVLIKNGELVQIEEKQILEFQRMIDAKVKSEHSSYIEAIADYCEESDVDYSTVKNLISVSLMGKIHEETIQNNLIKTTATQLPV